MRVQVFLPEAAVEAFHLGIVTRLAGPTEIELDAAIVRPSVHGISGKASIVTHSVIIQRRVRNSGTEFVKAASPLHFKIILRHVH